GRPTVDFARDVAPLLERSCAACHGGEKKKGGFSIASREAMIRGGQSREPALRPGISAESKLIQMVSDRVEDLEMPPLAKRNKYPALTREQIDLLKTWIDKGLPWNNASAESRATAPP
ncbi:MAG TPA: c-type cytochrome domain-containing protein, partial [Blastocatellia bacterium]|nr:c-type cytochrome domain-containing protein [Blastocatellia bacterium]